MKPAWPLSVFLMLSGCASADRGPSPQPARGVSSPVRKELSGVDLGHLARKEVRVSEKDGKTSDYAGVLLSDIVSHMGVSMGVHPKGHSPVEYVLVEGSDGYRALFSKAELDPIFVESQVLLADHHDGQALPDDEGPWRLIVPADRIRSRWVKQVKAIEISSPH